MLVRTLLIAFLIAGCSKKSSGGGGGGPALPPIQNTKPGLGKIVILGDSLAHGVGVTDAANNPENCLKSFGVEVANVSKPGLTSDGVMNDPDVRSALVVPPKLIFISLGGNDAIFDYYSPGYFPVENTMKNMGQIFDGLLTHNTLVVYLALTPPYPGAERLPAITGLAQNRGILTVDALSGMWKDSSKMSDQFHPNDAGYKVLCQRLLAALKNHYP